jgi:hypothetical protein
MQTWLDPNQHRRKRDLNGDERYAKEIRRTVAYTDSDLAYSPGIIQKTRPVATMIQEMSPKL